MNVRERIVKTEYMCLVIGNQEASHRLARRREMGAEESGCFKILGGLFGRS